MASLTSNHYSISPFLSDKAFSQAYIELKKVKYQMENENKLTENGPSIVSPREINETTAAYIERVLKEFLLKDQILSVYELLWWDGEQGQVYLGDNPLNDHHEKLINAHFKTRDNSPPLTDIQLRVEEIASRNTRYPIRDYLKNLKWDGISRIEKFAEKYFTDDNAVVEYADGSNKFMRTVLFHKWLVGAVARVMTNGKWQNPVLILAGNQNVGKSSFTKWLASGIGEKYHIESPINPDNKDHQMMVSRGLVWEITELGATTRRSDIEALKGFLTTHKFYVRAPYAKKPSDFHHLASYVGTVNPATSFLNDQTGNRRFWVLNIEKIDWDYTQEDIDQLWAEAVYLYENDFDCSLTIEEKRIIEEINELHNSHNIFEDLLSDICSFDKRSNSFTSTADLVTALFSLEMCKKMSKDQIQKAISSAMARLEVKPIMGYKDVDGVKKKRRGYEGVTINNKKIKLKLEEESKHKNLY